MYRLAKKHWFNDFGAYRPFVPQDHRQPKTNLDQVALPADNADHDRNGMKRSRLTETPTT